MLTKLKTFFTTYIRSISEPEFYREIYQKPFGFSLKYFFLFYFILGTISGIIFHFKFLPEIKTAVSEIVNIIDQEYPNDLVIDYKDSRLNYFGSQDGYVFSMPDSLKSDFSNPFEYALALGNVSDSSQSSGFVTLGNESMTVKEGNDLEVIDYSELEMTPFSISRDNVDDGLALFRDKGFGILNYLSLIVTVASWIILPLAVLVVIGLYTIFIWIVMRLFQDGFAFKKLFQLGLHAVTFAETARVLQTLLFAGLPLPSVFTWAYLGAMLMGLYGLNKNKNT